MWWCLVGVGVVVPSCRRVGVGGPRPSPRSTCREVRAHTGPLPGARAGGVSFLVPPLLFFTLPYRSTQPMTTRGEWLTKVAPRRRRRRGATAARLSPSRQGRERARQRARRSRACAGSRMHVHVSRACNRSRGHQSYYHLWVWRAPRVAQGLCFAEHSCSQEPVTGVCFE